MKTQIALFLYLATYFISIPTFSQDVVLDFDSQNGMDFEFINMGITDILQNKTAFTIEFRFNNLSPGHAATYFAQQNGDDEGVILMERYFGDNYIRIGGAGIAKWGFDPIAGNWHHYAIVFDGTGSTNDERLKIYLDGQLQSIDEWIETIPTSTPILNEKLYIGCKHYGMGLIGQDIEGQYEEFRIWDKALNSTEISAIINYEADGSENNLVGFFGFNEGVPNGNNQSITEIPFNAEVTGILDGFVLEGDTANFVSGNTTINLGLEELTEVNWSVYPNPSNGIFTVKLPISGKLIVTNTIGEIIKSCDIDKVHSEIDLTSKSSGLYFMNIISNEKTYTKKIVIE